MTQRYEQEKGKPEALLERGCIWAANLFEHPGVTGGAPSVTRAGHRFTVIFDIRQTLNFPSQSARAADPMDAQKLGIASIPVP